MAVHIVTASVGSIQSSFPYPDEFLVLVRPPLDYTEVDEAAERAIKTLLKFNPRPASSLKLLKTSMDDSFASSSPTRSPSTTSQEEQVRVRSNSNSQTCSGVGARLRSPSMLDKGTDPIHYPAVPRRCFLIVRISTRQVKLIYYNFCSEAR